MFILEEIVAENVTIVLDINVLMMFKLVEYAYA